MQLLEAVQGQQAGARLRKSEDHAELLQEFAVEKVPIQRQLRVLRQLLQYCYFVTVVYCGVLVVEPPVFEVPFEFPLTVDVEIDASVEVLDAVEELPQLIPLIDLAIKGLEFVYDAD